MAEETIVIGAGIVGICSALYLRRAGLAVTVIDRAGVGEGCSFGNAGNITPTGCAPAALPGILGRLPAMLRDPDGPLKVRLRDMPRLWPWFRRFVAASNPKSVEQIADARQNLLQRLDQAYAPLIRDAGAEPLIRRAGLLFVYDEEAGFAAAQYGLALRRSRGIAFAVLSGDEARELEPALAPTIQRAVHFPNSGHTTDPFRLAQAFGQLFVRSGGRIVRDEVTGFGMRDGKACSVTTSRGELPFAQALIAAGIGSRPLAARLGLKLPLEAERGYHVMFEKAGLSLRLPIVSATRSIAITEMDEGIRATGMAEFAGEAPPDYRYAELVLRNARRIVPGLPASAQSRWMGHRPAFPDSKPAIGRIHGHPSVYLATGHGPDGLALAAITGKVIAELMTGQPPDVLLEPFRPDRF